jgi:polar amino acid transport system substrate-binding protein
MSVPKAFAERPLTRSAAVVAALGLLVVAAGCGGSSSTSTTQSTPVSSASKVAGISIAVDPALQAKVPSAIRDAKVVYVGTDPTIPPWEMRNDGASTISGMDVDLGHAIGAKLGLEFRFAAQQFDGLIPAIQARKFDVSMSNMADTKERQQVVDFVDYAADGAALMVPKAAAATMHGLTGICGKKVALTAGSTYEQYVKTTVKQRCMSAGQAAASPLVFPTDAATQLAVKSGKATATLTDGPSAAYIARTVDGGSVFSVVEDPTAPTGYNPVPIGIAVTKAEPQLRDAIQAALKGLVADGTYRRVMAKYGLAAYGVKSVTVNSGS